MAQLNWTYVSDTGRRNVIGLYHGDQSGHLMVYCNSRVMLIDFHVLDSKSYSFFIDDELCEINLQRNNGAFSYGFEINKEVDTPKNRERRERDKRHLRKAIMVVAALVLFVLLIFFGLRYRNNTSFTNSTLVGNNARETVVRISLRESKTASRLVNYSFAAEGRVIKGRVNVSPEHTGMPLESGDEFVVKYAPGRPERHAVDLQRPSDRQIDRYRERALEKHRLLHPDLSKSRADCVIDVLFETGGVNAMADVFFQDRAPEENPAHNRQTYLTRINTPETANLLGNRCMGQ